MKSLHRLITLIIKEGKQLLRDPFSFILGILLPVVLLLICGYGMSTDIRNIRLAIVIPENSEYASRLVDRFNSSEYFEVLRTHSSATGERLVQTHQADACLFLPHDLTRWYLKGNVQVLIAINATNPSLAYTKESYIKNVLAVALSELTKSQANDQKFGNPKAIISSDSPLEFVTELKPRLWFNDANESTWTLIPGIIVIVLIVVGTLLTALVMAREYEQGNLESMFVTPMKSSEILVAKMINNFFLGLFGLAISLVMARLLFNVPIRASWYIIPLGSSVFLIMSLCMGLLISSIAKNQFIAIEIAVFSTFLPSFLLSGFIFEIKSMPTVLQIITIFVPARYFVDFLQTAFLVGDVWPNIFKNIGIISIFAFVFMFLAWIKNPKHLEG